MHTAEKLSSLQVPSHALTVHLPDVDVAEARERLLGALARAGFSVLADIDLQDILRRRIDLRIEPHFILEVCRPELASRALAVSSDASLLMPCKIAIWTEDKGAMVGMLPASRLVEALGRDHLDRIAAEGEHRLQGVLEELWKPAPRAPRPAVTASSPGLTLNEGERTTLVEALRQHRRALLVEAAGTEKHDLQHALAQNIEQLDALLARMAVTPPPPNAAERPISEGARS
jgi:uncharacterized protein (DUF302 family)